MASAARQRVFDAVGEEGAIGEAGQRVMERLMGQLRLEIGSLGDVMGVDHEAPDRRLVHQVPGGPLEHAPATVPMGDARLTGNVAAWTLGQRGKLLREHVAIVGMDGVPEDPPDQVLRREPEEPLDRYAHVADGRVAIDDEHQIGRVLGKRSEARLAVAEAVGQLAEPAVLAAESAGRAVEPDEEHQRQEECDRPGDQEDVTARRLDIGHRSAAASW